MHMKTGERRQQPTPRFAQLEHGHDAARPGDSGHLAQAEGAVRHVADPEADAGRGEVVVGKRQRLRVANDELDPRHEPVNRHLVSSDAEHAGRWIQPCDEGAGPRAGHGDRDVSCAARDIEDTVAGGQRSKAPHQSSPPESVQTEAHEAVEAVVARRDAIEHLAAAERQRCRLGRCRLGRGGL